MPARLADVFNGAVAVVTHQQADGKHVGQQGDSLADAAVFDEVIQRIQHEQRVHGADFLFNRFDNLLKALACGDEVVNHQREISFARAGAFAVKDVNLLFRHVFLCELNAQHRRVVRAPESLEDSVMMKQSSSAALMSSA